MSEHKAFPRIPGLPWSKGGNPDDLVLSGTSHFNEREVVQTTLFDGEGITLMRDAIYVCGSDSNMRLPHRSFALKTWNAVKDDIPKGWRLYCENMCGMREIYYDYLPSYLLGIAVINENGVFLPWDETIEWFELLNIEPVYDLWDGVWDEGVIKMGNLHNTQYTADLGEGKGYVVRVKAAFHEDMARWRMAKYIKANLTTTSKHWGHRRPQTNMLRVDIE